MNTDQLVVLYSMGVVQIAKKVEASHQVWICTFQPLWLLESDILGWLFLWYVSSLMCNIGHTCYLGHLQRKSGGKPMFIFSITLEPHVNLGIGIFPA